MLLLLFLGSAVVSLCSNLSYKYDCTNVVDAGKRHRLQGGKLSGNNLLASLMYEDNRGTPQLGFTVIQGPFFIYICNVCSVGHDKQKDVHPESLRRECSFRLGSVQLFLVVFLHTYFSSKSSHSAEILKKCICTTRNCLSDFLHKL